MKIENTFALVFEWFLTCLFFLMVTTLLESIVKAAWVFTRVSGF